MEAVITGLLLSGGALAMSFQNAFKRGFKKSCLLFFAFCSTFFALLVFVFSSGFRFSFDVGLLKYALSMGIVYSVCIITLTCALGLGYLSLSGLIMSASLILPTMYGIIFLHNDVSIFFIIGLIVLAASLMLVNLGNKDRSGQVEKIELSGVVEAKNNGKRSQLKWLIFILIAAVTNGFTSIIQTMQQTAYSGEKKNEFMIISLGIASAIILIASLFVEKSKIRDGFKQSVLLGAGSGVMNGLLNLAVMYSFVRVTAALVFPVISGASLLFTFLIAVAFFKEKYHKLQYAGYALGLISVILLNL